MKNFMLLLRVKHWVKNIIVLIPVCLVDGSKWNLNYGSRLIGTFVSFCLSASLIYILNDIIDRKSDLIHPRKKYRPIASGVIKVYQAVAVMPVLVGGLIGIQIWTGYFNQIIFAYIGLNVVYSVWLKRIPIVDLMTISLCYLLRISAGLEALNSPISFWMMIAIFFVTLSIIACKRRGEKLVVNEENAHRPVLEYYNVEFLNYTILITTIVAINAYVLFVHDLCIDHKSGYFIVYSIPVILFGILKYLHTIFTQNKGDDPVEIFLKDYSLLIVSVTCLVFLVRYSIS